MSTNVRRISSTKKYSGLVIKTIKWSKHQTSMNTTISKLSNLIKVYKCLNSNKWISEAIVYRQHLWISKTKWVRQSKLVLKQNTKQARQNKPLSCLKWMGKTNSPFVKLKKFSRTKGTITLQALSREDKLLLCLFSQGSGR